MNFYSLFVKLNEKILKLLKIKDKYIPTSIKRRYIEQMKEIKKEKISVLVLYVNCLHC